MIMIESAARRVLTLLTKCSTAGRHCRFKLSHSGSTVPYLCANGRVVSCGALRTAGFKFSDHHLFTFAQPLVAARLSCLGKLLLAQVRLSQLGDLGVAGN